MAACLDGTLDASWVSSLVTDDSDDNRETPLILGGYGETEGSMSGLRIGTSLDPRLALRAALLA